jgi:hypothetical protein
LRKASVKIIYRFRSGEGARRIKRRNCSDWRCN